MIRLNILENYLKKINSQIKELLSKYEVITYDSEKDIELGLLRFDEPPKGKAFLFKFSNEEIREFHTTGMKFPIKIYFFNKKEEIVYQDQVKPDKIISSKVPCKYVVEIA
jgi:uncharacterized membrane protein (UPF0127 family)